MADQDDDYELLPHKEIAELKTELERLKKGPSSESRSQMDQLTGALTNLLNLFKEASSQMRLEEDEGNIVSEKLIPIEEKLDQILDQNKKIAEGILAMADMIKDMKEERQSMKPMAPKPSFPSSFPSSMPPMPRQVPGNLPPLPSMSPPFPRR